MFDHILVPLDGSHLAECVLPHVLAFAQTFLANVTILNVIENKETAFHTTNEFDPLYWVIHKAEVEIYQQGICDRFKKAGLQISTAITEGRAADGIINYAHDHKVNLIVLSSHGLSGLSSWSISSVVQKVLSRAYTSLLIIPAYQHVQKDVTSFHYQKIFVGLDGSRRAECVLPEAMNLAAYHHASLLLAHVVIRPEMPPYKPLFIKEDIELFNLIVERNRRYAEIYFKELCSRIPEDLYHIKTYIVVSENPIDVLRELAEHEGADLVILSAHGNTGSYKRAYGSVTMNFITYGATPMLILQDLHPGIIIHTQAEMATREHPIH